MCGETFVNDTTLAIFDDAEMDGAFLFPSFRTKFIIGREIPGLRVGIKLGWLVSSWLRVLWSTRYVRFLLAAFLPLR